jgi:hypothetical protein
MLNISVKFVAVSGKMLPCHQATSFTRLVISDYIYIATTAKILVILNEFGTLFLGGSI